VIGYYFKLPVLIQKHLMSDNLHQVKAMHASNISSTSLLFTMHIHMKLCGQR